MSNMIEAFGWVFVAFMLVSVVVGCIAGVAGTVVVGML